MMEYHKDKVPFKKEITLVYVDIGYLFQSGYSCWFREHLELYAEEFGLDELTTK